MSQWVSSFGFSRPPGASSLQQQPLHKNQFHCGFAMLDAGAAASYVSQWVPSLGFSCPPGASSLPQQPLLQPLAPKDESRDESSDESMDESSRTKQSTPHDGQLHLPCVRVATSGAESASTAGCDIQHSAARNLQSIGWNTCACHCIDLDCIGLLLRHSAHSTPCKVHPCKSLSPPVNIFYGSTPCLV